MPWPFVGRKRELESIRSLLADPASGGVVLVGAAGAGKTRLAVEASRIAEARGFAVAWVRATRSGTSIPLGAFAGLLPAAAATSPGGADLLARAREALLRRAGAGRLVLCVDDGHLLDTSSAVLVHQLVAAQEAFLVVAVRQGEDVPDALRSLWKDELCARLDVTALPFEEVERVLEEALGGPVDGRGAQALWNLTRGNPASVREVVRYGIEREVLAEHGGVWRWRGEMAGGLRLAELVMARLAGLDAEALRVLEVVAAGAPLEMGMLDAAETAAMEGLERAGIVESRMHGRRRSVDLSHPLHGDVIRQGIPGSRLQDIQRRFAHAVEERGGRRHTDAWRLAEWRLASGAAGEPSVLEEAARQALAVLDFGAAERFAEAAVQAGSGFDALLTLAKAVAGGGRVDEADALLLTLEQRAGADGEREVVAIARARNLFWGADRAHDAEAILQRAEHAVSDEGRRDRLRALRIRLVAAQGHPVEALNAAEPLLRATAVDEHARLYAAAAAAEALLSRGRTRDALALIETWEPAARRHRESLPQLESQLLGGRAMALRLAGRLVDATEAAENMYALALARRSGQSTAIAATVLGTIWLARGRVRTALRFFTEGTALLRDVDAVGVLPWALAGLAEAAAQAGEAEPAGRAIEELDRIPLRGLRSFESELGLARAWSAAAAGELTRARALADEAVDSARSRGQAAYAVRALHDRARLGDARAAARALAEVAGGVDGDLAPLALAHATALVAHDGRALAEVADGFARAGALLLAAEAASAAAAAHHDDGREASARRAAERAASWLERCEGARPPALAGEPLVRALTPREREVAGLAARGLTSRAIAGRLDVSVRTVDNHLRNAYRKLGVVRREDLAGLLTGDAE